MIFRFICTRSGRACMHQGVLLAALSDMMQLTWASMCPSNLSKKSLGLCAHLPFVEDYVDFDLAHHHAGEFYFNAFNLDESRMEVTAAKLAKNHTPHNLPLR